MLLEEKVFQKSFLQFEIWIKFLKVYLQFYVFGVWGKNSPQYVTITEIQLELGDLETCAHVESQDDCLGSCIWL